MEIKFKVDDRETLNRLQGLSPRQFMIKWTGKVRKLAQQRARQRIGGDFGQKIAKDSILTDESVPYRHVIYTGGENGYIADHIHYGGPIRPKERKYLAIPIDRSVKGVWPHEYEDREKLVVIRRKEDGPRGRAYLALPMKRKVKFLWQLRRSVNQKPRPWWPEDWEVREVTEAFIRRIQP